jgi:hypothetical protein
VQHCQLARWEGASAYIHQLTYRRSLPFRWSWTTTSPALAQWFTTIPQPPIIAVDAVATDPLGRHTGREGLVQHLAGQLPLGGRLKCIGNARLPAAGALGGPRRTGGPPFSESRFHR